MTFWVLIFIAEMLEVKGTLYFFDTFMEKRDGGYRNRYRFFVYCGVLYLVAVTGAWIGMLKCIPIILVMSFLNLAYYEVSFRQSFLFSIINYTMLVLIDYVTVLLGRGGSIQEKWFLQALISKTVFIILMLFIRRFSKTRKSCGLITGKEWLQFFCVPVFTVVGFILMFYSENDDMQNVFLFLSVGLVAINLILMEFMQNTIEKEERIKIAVLTEQNQKNRIADYQDREEIYERQRRKMHDYKNQLSTIQTLIKNGHIDEALSFTQKLTESIAVEMSAINTNHPVVNAILNQKYRSMQEKHIAVNLKVGDKVVSNYKETHGSLKDFNQEGKDVTSIDVNDERTAEILKKACKKSHIPVDMREVTRADGSVTHTACEPYFMTMLFVVFMARSRKAEFQIPFERPKMKMLLQSIGISVCF